MRIAVTVLAASALVMTGCGSDSGGSITPKDDEAKTTTTKKKAEATGERDLDALVGAVVESDLPELAEQNTCVAESIIEDLSDEGYEATVSGDAEMATFSDSDIEVIIAGYDSCYDHATFVDLLLQGMATEGLTFDFTDEQRACMAESLESDIGSPGELMVALNDADSEDVFTASISGMITSCVDEESMRGVVANVFAAGEVDEASADCIIDGLSAELSASELFTMLMTEDPALDAVIESAGVSC
ncbi:MAG: hypothetical protein GX868_14690 [Actinobacteria bacterium]|nr:hypothetical protein [Actinomycetota bacterium]